MAHSLNPADEPAIDRSLDHYLEEVALDIALSKAHDTIQRARISALITLRRDLMKEREAFSIEATAKRHARGEIYSKSRVAAINSFGPTREQMDAEANDFYLRQGSSEDVLRAHARADFGTALVSKRLSLAIMPSNIAESARRMHAREEAFARAWVRAVNDELFLAEMRELQREAATLFRTASTPMYLHTMPPCESTSDEDAAVLGKVWSKLDTLCEALDVALLSSFIALDEEGEDAGVPAREILPSILALIAAVESGVAKIPSKKKAVEVLRTIGRCLKS